MPTRRNTTHAPMKCLLCRKPIVAGERYKKKRVGTEWHEVCVV